ncbi:ribosomal protein L7/L12 [Humidisolicoccus flavus]|uniref:ribosomal protein L7/L12 n=1 Tax=Humidisolicoccus flavus TaxID=3111414 RepID=UPI00324DB632
MMFFAKDSSREVAQLQQRVSSLEQQVAAMQALLDINPADLQQPWAHEAAQQIQSSSSGASPQILDLVRQGKKIEAIKAYREQTGVGLREAKEFVDRL